MTFVQVVRVVALALTGAFVEASSVSAATTDAIVVQPHAVLTGVKIPVLVPTRFPAGDGPIYLVLPQNPTFNPGGYAVSLSFAPGCDGGACNYATVEGKPGKQPHDPGARVLKVAGVGPVWWIDHGCQANCEGSFEIGFYKGGASYVVGITGGSLPQALVLVRSFRPLN